MARLVLLFALAASVTVEGVSVLNKLGDHWEFADDWDHFPRTAPLFPDAGTRWPRALEKPSKPPALTVVEQRHPILASVPTLHQRSRNSDRRKKSAVAKRDVIVSVPVMEIPIEVAVPVQVANNNKKRPTPAQDRDGRSVKAVDGKNSKGNSRDARDLVSSIQSTSIEKNK
jgi:hypothetical protein